MPSLMNQVQGIQKTFWEGALIYPKNDWTIAKQDPCLSLGFWRKALHRARASGLDNLASEKYLPSLTGSFFISKSSGATPRKME